MAKARATPVPIDRPLSKAYLRKFDGWTTEFPPGMSSPNSLRVMRNCHVATDESLRIRPGLKRAFSVPANGEIVGQFEHFYTPDGVRAILFAVRIAGGKVAFRTAVYSEVLKKYVPDLNIATRFPGASDAALAFDATTNFIRYVQIDNKILALSDSAEPFRLFWVGTSPKAKLVTPVTVPQYVREDRLTVVQPEASWVTGAQDTVPNKITNTTSTLSSTVAKDNIYNFAYFYTFSNEIGESTPSEMTQVKTQRRWNEWAADEVNEKKSTDQLVASIPQSVWDAAVAQGAVAWNLYNLTWSNQDPVPVEGVLLATTEMRNSDGTAKTRAVAGWCAHTPFLQGLLDTKMLPNANSTDNFSIPSQACNGLVAGDRLILVNDSANPARISWSSNLQGDYLNFTDSRGGGYKTLTSGNLLIPSTALLWQNPQSVDTITVLCSGIDGAGSAYYMSANTTTTMQSQSNVIMGFEETTATPGTVAPFACEVVNNALYHPLENNLMKSTASNYNINHSWLADDIANMWREVTLADKRRMVSAQLDSCIYFLVNSPVGKAYNAGSSGNQVWLCDTRLEGTWSCWDVGGESVQPLELDGKLYMSVTRGAAIYVFDIEQDFDDYWNTSMWEEKGIPWEIITNTQGANRAHDAWAHLQQVNVTFGNFTGECIYGIRGVDMNGKRVEVSKHFVATRQDRDPLERFDTEDYMLVRRALKEWEFFWRSATEPKNRSSGSVNFVQYRYTPVSVNIGYEFGSVETFEYQRNTPNYSNAVPEPFVDRARP